MDLPDFGCPLPSSAESSSHTVLASAVFLAEAESSTPLLPVVCREIPNSTSPPQTACCIHLPQPSQLLLPDSPAFVCFWIICQLPTPKQFTPLPLVSVDLLMGGNRKSSNQNYYLHYFSILRVFGSMSPFIVRFMPPLSPLLSQKPDHSPPCALPLRQNLHFISNCLLPH